MCTNFKVMSTNKYRREKMKSGPTNSHGMKVVREGENTKNVKG